MHNSPTFLTLFAIFFPGLVFQSVVGQKAATNGFSVDIIHRDSPLSPFYNDSITPSELLRKSALHSMERIKSIQSYIDQKAIQSVVIPNGGDYLMKLSFGTPPVEYFAIPDTGSNLIWIQCAPCPQTQCYSQGSPPFDPAASSTYQKLSCVSEACQALPIKSCVNTKEYCQYLYSYGDNSYTIGILSTDTLSFDSQNSFPKSVFGCGHNNKGNFRSPGAGLVGLGGGAFSLVSQIGTQIDHRFSYCLVPRSAKSSGKLIFGKESIISRPGAVSTPLITKTSATLYFLSLEGISIGDKSAQAASIQGNILIDSGTTLTCLEPEFYNSVETMVKEAIGAKPVANPPQEYSLCYGAETKTPDMIFHFTGANLRLQSVNTFGLRDGLLCMLIIPSPFNGLSIFGNYAQINFEVEYDLQKRTVSFAPTDCTKQ